MCDWYDDTSTQPLHFAPIPPPPHTPYSVIRRLVTLINERARLEASETAAIKQAQSASAEVKRLMEREEVEEEEGKKVRKGRNGCKGGEGRRVHVPTCGMYRLYVS